MPSPEERIAAAVASGLWKERSDPRTHRKYYVNTKTKKSVWNLIAELDKDAARRGGGQGAGGGGGGGGGGDRGAAAGGRSMREERQEKLRKKAEQIAELKVSIATLEQKKVEMESEIARLNDPVETETKQIEELRAQVNDMRFSLKVVETESSEKRKARDAELKAALSKVENLRSQVDAEKQHRTTIDSRQRQLSSETLELKAELHKEQVNTEALKATLRAAERKQEEVKDELRRLETEIAGEEDHVRLAEDDLKVVAKMKNEILSRIQKAESEKEELAKRLQGLRKSDTIKAKAKIDPNQVIEELATRYEKKRQMFKTLSEQKEREMDSKRYEHSNEKLRTILKNAQRDRDALSELAECLEGEIRRIRSSTQYYRHEIDSIHSAPEEYAVSGMATGQGSAAQRRPSSASARRLSTRTSEVSSSITAVSSSQRSSAGPRTGISSPTASFHSAGRNISRRAAGGNSGTSNVLHVDISLEP